MGDDVPPQIGGGGIAVEEQDRLARAHVHVLHPGAENLDVIGLEGEIG
jgi:hypothetical protein